MWVQTYNVQYQVAPKRVVQAPPSARQSPHSTEGARSQTPRPYKVPVMVVLLPHTSPNQLARGPVCRGLSDAVPSRAAIHSCSGGKVCGMGITAPILGSTPSRPEPGTILCRKGWLACSHTQPGHGTMGQRGACIREDHSPPPPKLPAYGCVRLQAAGFLAEDIEP